MASGLLLADAPGIGAAFGPPQWGIFDKNGKPLLITDSVADVEYVRDYRISDYPQEKGAFQSYNKVQVPYQAKVGFYIAASRTQFLNAIEAAAASLDLVTIVSPEIRYPSANLTHYGYRREVRSGVTLIRVEVWCEEVRIVSGADLLKSQSTNAASPTESGPVQPVSTTQNAPPASDGVTPPVPGEKPTPPTNGGGFTPEGGQPQLPIDSRPERLPGQGTIDIINDRNNPPPLPPGVPNATGGGESAVTTPFVNSVNESAATAIPF